MAQTKTKRKAKSVGQRIAAGLAEFHGKLARGEPIQATRVTVKREKVVLGPGLGSAGRSPSVTSQPLKRHGGKSYLASWIVSLMPARAKNPNSPADADPGWVTYCEPYFGGGAVLFAMDPEGIVEVVNDIDGELMNFWRVLQSPRDFEAFQRLVEAIPCSEAEFRDAKRGSVKSPSDGKVLDEAERIQSAARFFVRNRQSRQALEKDFATISRNRTRRGMAELPSAWLSAIEGLPAVHQRLRRVVIMDSDAIAVIRKMDGRRTLFYLDPPYLQSTRTAKSAYGKLEMSEDDHRRLLECLVGIEGKFMLSGYRNDLYDDFAKRHGWSRYEKQIDNKASGRKSKEIKTECLWVNYSRD